MGSKWAQNGLKIPVEMDTVRRQITEMHYKMRDECSFGFGSFGIE